MDSNRTLEPRLVEIDNLGEATSSPTQYSVLWWLKRIYEAILGTTTTNTFDESSDWVDVDTTTDTQLLTIDITSGETLRINAITCSLAGFMGRFWVEYYNGTSTKIVRNYILSPQQNSYTELVNGYLKVPYVGSGSYLRVYCKLFSQNQTGKAFVAINGYKE